MTSAVMDLSVPEIVVCLAIAALVLWQVVEVFLRVVLHVFEKVQRKYGLPRNVMTGREALIGRTAVVIRAFEVVGYGRVEGLVSLGGGTWNARLKGAFERPARIPTSVRVEEVEGLTLIVSVDLEVKDERE